MLENTPDQLSKFRTKNWVEINNNACRTYNTYSQTEFETTMLKSSLCNYSDTYILAEGTISVTKTAAADASANNVNIMWYFQVVHLRLTAEAKQIITI